MSGNKEIRKDINVYEKVAQNITFKQESHIEALLACFTLDIDNRLRAFLHSLIKSYYKPNYAGWNPMPVRLTATLIASIISASRTSVSLTLSDWMGKGWMKRRQHNALPRLYLYELEGLVGAGRLIEIFLSDYWLNLISNPEIC